MEERRLLLALALLMLVLMAHQWLFGPDPSKVLPPRPTTAASATPASSPAPEERTSSPIAATLGRAATDVPRVTDERERRVELHGPGVEIGLTNRGGRILSWRLKTYTDRQGRGEEMVESVAADVRPLDIETDDRALDQVLRTALFRPSSELVVAAEGGEATLELEFAEGAIHARKTLTVSKGFLVTVVVSVQRNGTEVRKRVLWGPGLENATPEDLGVQGYTAPQGVVLAGGGTERRPAAKKLAEQPWAVSSATWVGVETRYFTAVLIPSTDTAPVEVRAQPVGSAEKGERWAPVAILDLGVSTDPMLIYVGPKDHDGLVALGHQLEKVVPIGDWLGRIVVPFMQLLRWVHSHVGNYGWSIIWLTVVINLLMAPLRHASIANGRKMAKMAPEMRVVQERYRKLPLRERQEKMHTEMTALYAKHGLNMGSQMIMGCLPLLLTMPFLFAFYQVLQVSIVLRGAEFLWIPDLSRKDPLFITPVLMGVSMFVMQNLTPTSLEPAQKRIMMMMPLVFVTMLFAAPAGLNLYWLASNICAVIQQGVTLKILGASEESKERKKK